MRLLAVVALAQALLSAFAFSASAQARSDSVPRGSIIGIVRDSTGRPLPGASVIVLSLSRATRSDSLGRFSLRNLPAGELTLVTRATGYAPRQAVLRLPADSTLNIAITMRQSAQTLGAVVVSADVENQLSGTVTDSTGRPLAGVAVDVLGLRRDTRSGADGRWLMLDLEPGAYVVQFRAPGYRVSQYSVRMAPQVDRSLAVKLFPIDANDRFTAEMAELVAVEASLRRAWRSRGVIIVGRDELERFDNAPLATALNGSSAVESLRNVDLNCLLIDGFEPLTQYSNYSPFRSVRLRGAPTSINGAVANANAAARPGSTGPRTVSWLSHFLSSEVELVEVYPVDADLSGTLRDRFPTSTGCGTSALIIWLRR